jgi:2-hydroxy-3-oxopropionate reductase
MKIGFIGLGIMGRPMATNLLKAGHSVVVRNRSRAAEADLVALGATAAESPKAVAEQCDLVITMLPNSPDVRDVCLGEGGIAEGAHEGLVVVDMSSIAPLVAREVGEALATRGVTMLDAPVSGGEPGAIAGTLAIMVGGDEATFERVKEVLLAMGRSATYVGPLGAGNIAKLANQTIVAVNIAVLGEALVLARKSGVDPAAVLDAIKGGLAGSAVMNAKGPMMLAGDYPPGFRIELHVKDLENVLATGHSVQSALPLTAAVREMMTGLLADGHASSDHSALVTHYETLGRVRLPEA